MDDMFDPDPYGYFDSVAGPSIDSIAGPSGSVLDTFPDGTPVAEAQSAVANGVGGGHRYPWQRGDVQAALIMVAGAGLVYLYSEN